MQNLISVCAWCKLVKTPQGWLEEAAAFQVLDIGRGDLLLETTHGICPACVLKWTKMNKAQFDHAYRREAARAAV